MKKIFIWGTVAILIIATVIFIIRSPEDDWIRDDQGMWIKHGEPIKIPDEVVIQKDAIDCTTRLYQKTKIEGMIFESQCLGVCDDYAIDIVSVPRSEKDDLIENQCEEYGNGLVANFIELNKEGNIVRIVD